MLSLLTSIVDSVISIFRFIGNTIASIYNLILHIPTYTTFLLSSFGFMPDIFIPFVISFISLSILLLVVRLI